MTTICVPAMDETPWPTLGPAVVAWMEENLVFGPGDLRGEPYRLTNEQKAFIYRIYDHFTKVADRRSPGQPRGWVREYVPRMVRTLLDEYNALGESWKAHR